MLKKAASFVLASFRPSTYPRGYASGPSLAAALLAIFLSTLHSLLPFSYLLEPSADGTKIEHEALFVSGYIQTVHVLRFTFHE
jgi:hypothetical protein